MTPLLRGTLALCLGLLIGLRSPPGLPVMVPLALASGVLLAMRGRGTLFLAFCAAGVVAGGLRSGAIGSDCRTQLADGAAVRVIGVPQSLPAEGTSVLFRAAAAGGTGSECGGVIRVRVRPAGHELLVAAARGETGLELRGRWLAHAPRNGWPRPPHHAGMLLVDSAAVAGDVRAGPLIRLRTAQQARLRVLLPERWGVAEAMLLAQKSGLTPEIRGRWVAAGLVHLLAISGMHVGMIAAGVVLLCGRAGLPRRRARRVAIAVTAAYVIFLGAPSAALRALLQATLLLASLELQRPAEPFTALSAAALGILLLEPMALLDPGFQLSFAGVIGLIAWRRPLAGGLPAALPAWLRDGLATGIAASALTTPIAALHFGTASWIGVLATIVAAPVLAVAVALLFASLLVAALTAASAGPLAMATDAALRLLDAIAATAAAVPGGHGHLATPTVLYGLLGVAAAVIVRAWWRGARPRSRNGREAAQTRLLRAGVGVAVVTVIASWAPLLLPGPRTLEIHAIDVGQGDALAVRTPGGRWLLVDTGPRSARFDAGRDRVVPYLLRRGVRRLDVLVLTHPDADHIGGAEAVLEAFDTGVVIDPGFPAGKDMFIDLLAAARGTGGRWVAARAGQSFLIDGVQITMLYPTTSLDGAPDANDNSVVFRLAWGDFAALFTGDAPMAVEDAIVARNPAALRAQLLKVGHHGSRTSTGEPLLLAARPELALVSAGRNNRYGHPNPGVLRRLESHGVRVLRTDRLGSIIVRAARDGRVEVLAR